MTFKHEGYWTFVCDPRIWAIDAFLRSGRTLEEWGIPERFCPRISRGQLAVVRVGVDRRTKARLAKHDSQRLEPGIYDLCETVSQIQPRSVAVDKFTYDASDFKVGAPVVKVRYLASFLERPLTIANLKRLEPRIGRAMITGVRASSPLSAEDFHRILRHLDVDEDILASAAQECVEFLDSPDALLREYGEAAPEVKKQIMRLGGRLRSPQD